MDKVFSSFEGYVHAQKRFAKWFDMTEEDNKRMIELYHTGYAFPLAERDADGKKIIFIQLRHIDPDYFTSADGRNNKFKIKPSLLKNNQFYICYSDTFDICDLNCIDGGRRNS